MMIMDKEKKVQEEKEKKQEEEDAIKQAEKAERISKNNNTEIIETPNKTTYSSDV